MNIMQTAKSTRLSAIEDLIDLSIYQVDPDGWDSFVQDIKDIFAKRDETTKKQIRAAGGYISIFDMADIYFGMESSTVAVITQKFQDLMTLPPEKIKGDSSAYRAKIAERFNYEWDRFAYPSDFIVAYDLILLNREVLR